jgi:hypothetical protein
MEGCRKLLFDFKAAQFINIKPESELISEHADYFTLPFSGLQLEVQVLSESIIKKVN